MKPPGHEGITVSLSAVCYINTKSEICVLVPLPHVSGTMFFGVSASCTNSTEGYFSRVQDRSRRGGVATFPVVLVGPRSAHVLRGRALQPAPDRRGKTQDEGEDRDRDLLSSEAGPARGPRRCRSSGPPYVHRRFVSGIVGVSSPFISN